MEKKYEELINWYAEKFGYDAEKHLILKSTWRPLFTEVGKTSRSSLMKVKKMKNTFRWLLKAVQKIVNHLMIFGTLWVFAFPVLLLKVILSLKKNKHSSYQYMGKWHLLQFIIHTCTLLKITGKNLYFNFL